MNPNDKAKNIIAAITTHPELALPIITELCQTVEDLKVYAKQAPETPPEPRISHIDVGELW